MLKIICAAQQDSPDNENVQSPVNNISFLYYNSKATKDEISQHVRENDLVIDLDTDIRNSSKQVSCYNTYLKAEYLAAVDRICMHKGLNCIKGNPMIRIGKYVQFNFTELSVESLTTCLMKRMEPGEHIFKAELISLLDSLDDIEQNFLNDASEIKAVYRFKLHGDSILTGILPNNNSENILIKYPVGVALLCILSFIFIYFIFH